MLPELVVKLDKLGNKINSLLQNVQNSKCTAEMLAIRIIMAILLSLAELCFLDN